MKNAFSVGLYNVYHKKVLVLRCKVLVLVLNIRLGLEIKVLVLLDLGLEKSLAYITVDMLVIIMTLKDTETFHVLFIVSVCCAWSISLL